MTAASPPRKKINLALQGGGAHGAFAWGVLDLLLEDGRLDFDGLSGTSAGAMNAVSFAEGFRKGGREGARAQLAEFWKAASLDGLLPAMQRSLVEGVIDFWRTTPAVALFNEARGLLGPDQRNPLHINPLRSTVSRLIDFEALRASNDLKLFVAATNVQTGKVRVFHRSELTLDMVMASACLPTLFPAVEIDGAPYWDGGYMGNPALFPLFTETESLDIVLVQLNPIMRRGTPRSADEIMTRIDEITFNASLLHELRAIDFVARLIEAGRLHGAHYKAMRMHVIEAQDALDAFGAASRVNADYNFFVKLRDLGRKAAEKFLDAHFAAIGVRASFDIRQAISSDPPAG